MGEIKSFQIEQGALREVPIYESHRRGKNWAATITIDHAAPGGVRRAFWPRAKGEYYYHVPAGTEIGAPVEFGADYTRSGGNRRRTRWYGVVRSITEAAIAIEEYPDARTACQAQAVTIGNAEKIGKTTETIVTTEEPKTWEALETREAELLTDLAKLEEELDAVRAKLAALAEARDR
jgi:hypothetical protein